MAGNAGKGGFTLVEALLACALLAIVLVPALSAFRSHIAATTRRAGDLATAIALDDLANRVEYEVFMTNAPGASVSRTGLAVLTVSAPSEERHAGGAAALVRYVLGAGPIPGGAGRPRRSCLCLVAPAATNGATR